MTPETQVAIQMATAAADAGEPLPPDETKILLAELARRDESLRVYGDVSAEDQAELATMRMQLIEVVTALADRTIFTATPAAGRGTLKRCRDLLLRIARSGQQPVSELTSSEAPVMEPEAPTNEGMEV